MKNIAPHITRQRLLIEGFYTINVTRETIPEFFKSICGAIGLRMYGEPIIFSPAGMGKAENQGYDAFVPKAAQSMKTFFKLRELEKLEF